VCVAAVIRLPSPGLLVSKVHHDAAPPPHGESRSKAVVRTGSPPNLQAQYNPRQPGELSGPPCMQAAPVE
jgi:hypothetical protein